MIMRIKRRIYGIENELGVVMRYDDKVWGDVALGRTLLIHKPNDTSVRPFTNPIRIWHTNGSCSYIDTGEHPEYASPECSFIKDAVLYAKAGELLMNRILCTPVNGARMMLIKNNLGYDLEDAAAKSFGCHENYLMHGLNLDDPAMTKRLIPFLITRQIMDGAGWWESDGTFLFSQRSLCMEDEVGNSTTNNRPLITKRDTLNDTGPMRRLHLILGDANILDAACFLKLGTTSLVLSLIEAGCAPLIEYGPPILTMKRIARNPDITVPQTQQLQYGGKELSAFDVQTLYCEIARRELASAAFDSEEIRAEMYCVLDLWEQALHALFRRDEQWMIGRFDYATKHYLAERVIKQRQLSSPSDIKALRKDIDLMYHNITDRTLQNRMNIQWADRRMLTDKQIEKAVYFPPRNTRAGMRGLFVASILDMPMRVNTEIDWLHCTDADLPESQRTAFIKDPFDTRNSDFIEFLLRSQALPHNQTLTHYMPCDG